MANGTLDRIAPESPLVDAWADQGPASIYGKGIEVHEQPQRGKLVLVTDGSDGALRNAVAVLGAPLQDGAEEKTGDDPCCIWRARGRWLVAHGRGEVLATGLNAALSQGMGAAVDVSDGWVSLAVTGSNANALLGRGCQMDFHARIFPRGRFAETTIAGIDVLIHAFRDKPGYEVLVERALAVDLWLWLKEHAVDLID